MFAFGKSWQRRAVFYREWAALLHAGIDLLRALTILVDQNTDQTLKTAAAEMAANIQRGQTLRQSIEQQATVFTLIERRLIAFGEESGHLDTVLTRLADWAEFRWRQLSRLGAQLVYPFFLLNLAIFLLPLPLLFSRSIEAYSHLVMSNLAVCYGIGFGIYGLIRAGRTGAATSLDHLLHNTPVYGPVMQKVLEARFFFALSTTIQAGFDLNAGLRLAAEVCGNVIMHEHIEKQLTRLKKGGSFAQIFENKTLFSAKTAQYCRTGEASGRLEEMTARLARDYEAESAIETQNLTVWLPRLIYIGVVIYAGVNLLSFVATK